MLLPSPQRRFTAPSLEWFASIDRSVRPHRERSRCDHLHVSWYVLCASGYDEGYVWSGHRRVHGAIFLVLLVCSQVYTSSCTIHKLASLQAFTFLELNWVALLVAYSLYRRHIGQGLRLGSYSILHTTSTSRRAYSTCTTCTCRLSTRRHCNDVGVAGIPILA